MKGTTKTKGSTLEPSWELNRRGSGYWLVFTAQCWHKLVDKNH